MKSNFTIEQINDYANKLLIGLYEEEAKTIQGEFNVIEASMDLINEIPDIDNVEPIFAPFDLYYAQMRDDEAVTSVPIENLLQNCKEYIDREIEVPKVVGNSES